MRWALLFALFLVPVGCAEDYDDDTRLARGYTPCNDLPNPENGVICHPNQYCASQKNGWCHTGCLSDDNCSHEQVCAKNSGQNWGTCTDLATFPAVDEEDLDPGYTACGNPQTPARFEICQPSQHCGSWTFGDCWSGCLSEDNCTENQDCAKSPGENVGVCVCRDCE